MTPTRKRSEHGRRHRRRIPTDAGRPHAVRVPHGRDDVVVEVHVHNEIHYPEEPALSGAAIYVPPERSSPGFSGTLFSWREHYDPIFKKIVPLMSERAARHRRLLSWLGRLTVWVAALAALTTVGCQYFRASG